MGVSEVGAVRVWLLLCRVGSYKETAVLTGTWCVCVCVCVCVLGAGARGPVWMLLC